MSEKIALIGFGGTIAMAPNAEGALEPAFTADQLVDQAPGLRKLGVDLDVIQLSNEDSTDLAPEDWQLLIGKVAELHSQYDGLIVTHGTDTMPYTATALALALGEDLSLPIIFTGAQETMDTPGTDARVNLERSMKVMLRALEECVTETMIVFSNKVLRATRTIKINESSYDAFDSPGFPHLSNLTAGNIFFNSMARRKSNMGFSLLPRDQFDSGVVSIDTKPGLRPENVRALTQSETCSALILKSLGAGNVPSKRAEYSLLPVITETVEAGKPVILATKFVGGRTRPEIYAPGRAALESGAGHAGNMTDVAAEVKLMWLMGQGVTDPEKVKRAMLVPYSGEVDQA